MSIHWDSTGTRGVSDRFEITLYPIGEGWSAVVFAGKTHMAKLAFCLSKVEAQETADVYLKELRKTTKRLLSRIGYDHPNYREDEDGEEGW